jgi:hypothetical protein
MWLLFDNDKEAEKGEELHTRWPFWWRRRGAAWSEAVVQCLGAADSIEVERGRR